MTGISDKYSFYLKPLYFSLQELSCFYDTMHTIHDLIKKSVFDAESTTDRAWLHIDLLGLGAGVTDKIT